MSDQAPETGTLAELHARLRRELDHRIDELTVIIPARLGTDQRYGDYRDTIVLQRRIQARIQDLRKLITGLERMHPGACPRDAGGFGSILHVRDLDSGEEFAHALLAGDRVDPEAGEVSLDSPLGAALAGCRAGDETEVATSEGPRRLRVLSVATLFERVGVGPAPPPAIPRG